MHRQCHWCWFGWPCRYPLHRCVPSIPRVWFLHCIWAHRSLSIAAMPPRLRKLRRNLRHLRPVTERGAKIFCESLSSGRYMADSLLLIDSSRKKHRYALTLKQSSQILCSAEVRERIRIRTFMVHREHSEAIRSVELENRESSVRNFPSELWKEGNLYLKTHRRSVLCVYETGTMELKALFENTDEIICESRTQKSLQSWKNPEHHSYVMQNFMHWHC